MFWSIKMSGSHHHLTIRNGAGVKLVVRSALACEARRLIHRSVRSLKEIPTHCDILRNYRQAWWATVMGVQVGHNWATVSSTFSNWVYLQISFVPDLSAQIEFFQSGLHQLTVLGRGQQSDRKRTSCQNAGCQMISLQSALASQPCCSGSPLWLFFHAYGVV